MIFIHLKATSNPIWERNNPKQKQNEKLLVMKRKIYHLTETDGDRMCLQREMSHTHTHIHKKGKSESEKGRSVASHANQSN